MKKFIIAIFCLAIVSITFSQKSDAEFQKIVKEYNLNEDGSVDYHYTKSLKLLSHFAFHRLYGETFIVYNTDFQDLKINSSYTIMADGKKIVTPNNAFNEVLPSFANNSPAYNHIREMVVTHTGLQVGATINLDYTINTEGGFYPLLMGNEILQESSPVKELIIKVIIPENKTLNYSVLNIEGEPLINNKNGKKTFIWTFNSLAASSKDSYQDNYLSSSPRLIFSTKNVQEAFAEFDSQQAFNYTSNEGMTKVVGDIQKVEKDDLSLVLELQKTVSQNLVNLNIPLEHTGFKCRNSIDTWNSNQGTKLEKAILLTSLLRNAGIKAQVVAVTPISFYNKDIGNLMTIKDFKVKVQLKKLGDIYLSSNKTDSQNQKYKLGEDVLISLNNTLSKPEVIFNKVVKGEISVEGMFDLQNDKLLGNMSVELKNSSNPYFKFYNDSSSVISTIKDISKKDIKTFDIEKFTQDKSKFSISIEKENPTVVQGDYHRFKLPFASNGVESWNMNILTQERTSPLEIPQLINENYEYKIVLPPGSKLLNKPISSTLTNDFGSIKISIKQNNNEVIIIREIRFNKTSISISEYPKFKGMMDLWNNDKYRFLIYKY